MRLVNESIMTLQEAIVARHSVRQYLELHFFLLVNQPCHTSTDNMVFSKVLEVQVGGKVKLYTA